MAQATPEKPSHSLIETISVDPVAVQTYQDAARAVLNADCLQFGGFQGNGHINFISWNLDKLVENQESLVTVVSACHTLADQTSGQLLAGVPDASPAIAKPLAERLLIPYIQTHLNETISTDGVFKAGQTVTLLEAVLNTGGTALSSVITLRRSGLIVDDMIAVIDRMNGGIPTLQRSQVRTLTLFNDDNLLQFYLQEGLLSGHEAEQAFFYLRALQARNGSLTS